MTTSMYIIANVALGGWPGLPDATTPFPAELKIYSSRLARCGSYGTPGTGRTDGAETYRAAMALIRCAASME